MDSIYLVGSDDVRGGGNAMREAAQQMNNAAASIQFTLEQHQRFLDDWLLRFCDALAVQSTIRGERTE